jgi:hypothetical protein
VTVQTWRRRVARTLAAVSSVPSVPTQADAMLVSARSASPFSHDGFTHSMPGPAQSSCGHGRSRVLFAVGRHQWSVRGRRSRSNAQQLTRVGQVIGRSAAFR